MNLVASILRNGGAGELGQPPRDLGLADAGRADHQDVLGQYLLAHRALELLAAPAVAERDGDGALGVGLADDEAVEFGDDFAWRETGHGYAASEASCSNVTLVLVYMQMSAAIAIAFRAMVSASISVSARARAAASA